MTPPLEPKALERIWTPPIGCALPPCASPLLVLAITPIAPVPHPVGKLQARVVCPGPLLPLRSLGDWGCYYHCNPSMASLPRAIWHTRGIAALSRAAMSLAICNPNFAIPSPRSVATVGLALTLSQISSFSLSVLQAVTISCK